MPKPKQLISWSREPHQTSRAGLSYTPGSSDYRRIAEDAALSLLIEGHKKPKAIFAQTGLGYKSGSKDYKRLVSKSQRQVKKTNAKKMCRFVAKTNVMLARYRSKTESVQRYKREALEAKNELEETQSTLRLLKKR